MKKALVILLALALVAGVFVGCEPAATTSPNPSDLPSGEPSTEPSAAPVELKIMREANINWDPTYQPLQTFYEEKSNVKITWDVAPGSAYQERLQILVSSGSDLPDLCFMKDGTLLHDVAADGMLYALDDLLATTSNIYPYVPEVGWVSGKPLMGDDPSDETIYAVPKPIMNRQSGLGVRKDWLDALGITIPENGTITLDELNEIMRRFTEDDPDQNGADDTFGYIGSPEFFTVMPDIVNSAFRVLGWRKTDQGPYTWMRAEYDQVGTGYEEKIAWVAMLWQNGWVDPNAPNNGDDIGWTRFAQGISGACGGNPRDVLKMEAVVKASNPDAAIDHISWVLKTADQAPMSAGIGAGVWSWMVIFDNGDITKAEAAMRLMDYIYSDEGFDVLWNGIEGIDYVVINGEKSFTEHATIHENFDRPVYDMLGRGNAFPRAFLGSLTRSDEELERTTRYVENGMKNIYTSWAEGYTPGSAREQSLVDYVANVWTPGVAAIIAGQASIDTLDGIVQGWYDAGGTQVVEDFNAYLDRVAPADLAVGY